MANTITSISVAKGSSKVYTINYGYTYHNKPVFLFSLYNHHVSRMASYIESIGVSTTNYKIASTDEGSAWCGLKWISIGY